MNDSGFVDNYELLEANPNANSETLERLFRYLARKFHPDNTETGDAQRFQQIVQAYQALGDPESRAAYDIEYRQHQEEAHGLVREASETENDVEDRIRLLTIFYAKRRRGMKDPGVGLTTIEYTMGLPFEVLDFHLWYFREKGWIQREESGTFAITAEGVDRIEQESRERTISRPKRITDEALKVEDATSDFPSGAAVIPAPPTMDCPSGSTVS